MKYQLTKPQKMIISQFCRGKFMENEISVADNAPLGPTGIPKSVNSQVSKLFYDEFNVS